MAFIKYSNGEIKKVVEKTNDNEESLQEKLSSAMQGETKIEKEAATKEDDDDNKKPSWAE